jgi:tetratricopeptide (TPR) repeat protein
MAPKKPNQKNSKEHAQLMSLLVKIDDAIDQGHAPQARVKLLQLDKRFPNTIGIVSLLGKANLDMGRHQEGVDAYQQLVKLVPKDPEARFQLALAMQRNGQYEQALDEYERVLYYAPDHFYALRRKCGVLTDVDRNKDALKVWENLKEKFSGQDVSTSHKLAIAVTGARLAPKVRDASVAIREVEQVVEDPSSEDELRVAGYWQIGRLYHHLKEYDKAFDNYTKSKQLKTGHWDPDEHSKRIDQLIKCWTGGSNIPVSDVDGSRLIFIVGMMRSGTSLTEQMIAQMQGVTPGGEMNAISRQASMIEPSNMEHARPYPLTSKLYTKTVINKMAHGAMEMYNAVERSGTITDKQPYNYAYVPLISHMFPGCKIIHCMRDPLDCCLSNYTQAFARPHLHTHELYWLGRYYQDYKRLMESWHTIDQVDMIDLKYEDLVSDPETQSRRVAAFLGRDWTPEILEFHRSDRTVATASRDQVRQPLYKSSVAKYKHYEHHLDELKRGLGIEMPTNSSGE